MNAYQYNTAGFFEGQTVADESPLEPGVYLMPARTTLTAPPAEIPDGQWPRWNGSAWALVNKPVPVLVDPVAKLQAFLAANPDVSLMLEQSGNT